jgi:hypothetical protein
VGWAKALLHGALEVGDLALFGNPNAVSNLEMGYLSPPGRTPTPFRESESLPITATAVGEVE